MAVETTAPTAGARTMTTGDVALYALVVFVWGTSWIGMRWQVGVVEPEVSALWRFASAAPLMFAWAIARGQRLAFPLAMHARFAAMGLFMFSTNLILFYNGSLIVTTGLMAVVFSLASLFNAFLAVPFLGQRLEPRLLIAGVVGTLGVALMFAPEIGRTSMDGRALLGLVISAVATLSFCSGTIVSAAVQKRGIPVLASSAWGMLYGSLFLFAYALLRGSPFIVEWNVRYLATLAWLSVVASVIAFAAYLTLMGRIGASRTGYSTVLFPVIALAVSTVIEGYQWTAWAVAGLVLVAAGNLMALRR